MRRALSLMRLVPLACLALGACQGRVTIQHRVAIRNPPPLVAMTASALQVPTSCPVYAAGGGDVDTPEQPFPSGVSIICVVDDKGETYGIVIGDAPTGQRAVVPGSREIGLYFGFDEPEAGLLSSYDDLSGDSADLKLWASPPSLPFPTETSPDGRLELRTVAQGPQGVLVSLGRFDGAPMLVGGSAGARTWGIQFYVNGPW